LPHPAAACQKKRKKEKNPASAACQKKRTKKNVRQNRASQAWKS
jgi:hypothetical protein